jgi:hypothetical protein
MFRFVYRIDCGVFKHGALAGFGARAAAEQAIVLVAR